MIICPICGAQLEDTAIFCSKCGNRLEVQKTPKLDAKQPPAQKPPKKKMGALIGIAAAAIVAVAAVGAFATGLIKPQNQGGNANIQVDAGQNSEDNHTTQNQSSISGYDVFQGEHYDQMLWGHYQLVDYEPAGTGEETVEFRQDMKYFDIAVNGYVKPVSVLPISIVLGRLSHFWGNFYYENQYYYPYTELGMTMYRKAYIEEIGDMTEEEFKKIEYAMNLMLARLTVVSESGAQHVIVLSYKIEGNMLSLYEFSIDDQNNVTQANEPVLQYEFLHDGGTLYLANEGIQRSYRPYGYDATDNRLSVSGYALNESQQYQDLEGIVFWNYNYGEELIVYPKLTGGDKPVDPAMTIDLDTGSFTLSWTERWSGKDGYREKIDDPTTISGTVVPCMDYGSIHYSGFIMIIDGTQYRYLMSQEEYDERRYTELSENANLSDSDSEALLNTRRNILEELEKAFREAGITATVDYSKGQIGLEANFLFDTGSYELSQAGQIYLDTFVDVYSAVVLGDDYSDYISRIVVEGHTDTSGSYSMNQTLSQNRANAVAQRCIGRNAKMADIVQAVGCSYDYPVYNDDGTVDMDASRRVTFRFVFANN